MLSATGLCLIRGDRCLFEGLDFALDQRQIMLIEGTNGSGKTSLLKAIAGLIDLEAGELRWRGEPVGNNPQRFRASLAWFAHRTGFKADLSARENLRFECGMRAVHDLDIDSVLQQVGVARAAHLPMRSMSAGQQRRVALARMLMADAVLWLMDEPLTNLDAEGQELVRQLILQHVAGGGMCIVASHQPLAIDATVLRVRL